MNSPDQPIAYAKAVPIETDVIIAEPMSATYVVDQPQFNYRGDIPATVAISFLPQDSCGHCCCCPGQPPFSGTFDVLDNGERKMNIRQGQSTSFIIAPGNHQVAFTDSALKQKQMKILFQHGFCV